MLQRIADFAIQTVPGKIACFLLLGLYYYRFINKTIEAYNEFSTAKGIKRYILAVIGGLISLIFPIMLTAPLFALFIVSLFIPQKDIEVEHKVVTKEVVRFENYEDAYQSGFDAGYDEAIADAEREEEEREQDYLDSIRGY